MLEPMEFKLILLVVAMATCRADIPDDNISTWPSPTEVVNLGKRLTGDVYFPKSARYILASTMKNTRFNTRFGVVVMVQTTEDVREVINFCQQYGIRPTIRSSGHDYIGRASGDHTISINLRRMNKILVKDDPRAESGVSAIVQPGNSWADVYKNLHEAGYLIIGGSCPTVSPGGYTQGGGHSPMSRMFGLGVDNVIEFTLVTTDGSIIKHTRTGGSIIRPGSSAEEPYDDPDLFWAIRGGGGGTFGIVTTYTFQLHVPPEDGFCRYIGIYPMVFGGDRVSSEVLNTFSRYLRYNMTDNWGGYIITTGAVKGNVNASDPGSPELNGILTFSLLHVGGCQQAKPQTDFLMNMFPQYAFHRELINYTTFWDYQKEVNDPTGYRTYIINRFIQPEDLEAPQKLSDVLTDVVDTEKDAGCTWTTLGGKVSTFDQSSAAISPAFRSSFGSLSCGVGWGLEAEDQAYIHAMQDYGRKLYTIGDGVYFNEPDQYLINWQKEYWGPLSNYERLLEVKQKYDRDQMLWCHNCVGSEMPQPVRHWAVGNAARVDRGKVILVPMFALLLGLLEMQF